MLSLFHCKVWHGSTWSLLPHFHCRVYHISPEGVCQHRYSILTRVCVTISKQFSTWVNCDHCSPYFIAGSITLLLRACVWCSVIDTVLACLKNLRKHFATISCLQCNLEKTSVISYPIGDKYDITDKLCPELAVSWENEFTLLGFQIDSRLKKLD